MGVARREYREAIAAYKTLMREEVEAKAARLEKLGADAYSSE